MMTLSRVIRRTVPTSTSPGRGALRLCSISDSKSLSPPCILFRQLFLHLVGPSTGTSRLLQSIQPDARLVSSPIAASTRALIALCHRATTASTSVPLASITIASSARLSGASSRPRSRRSRSINCASTSARVIATPLRVKFRDQRRSARTSRSASRKNLNFGVGKDRGADIASFHHHCRRARRPRAAGRASARAPRPASKAARRSR